MKYFLQILVLISFSNSYASIQDLAGVYTKTTGVRFFTDADACKAENGEYDSSDGSCIFYSPSGNSISISQIELSGKNQYKVEVETLWGPANQRSYSGIVTGFAGNQITVREVDSDSNRPIQHGCILTLIIKDGQASALPRGKYCDSGLTINGATKSK